MNENFIKLFALDNEQISKNIKWSENIKFDEKVQYKNLLVENTIKYPLKEALKSTEKKIKWTKILGTNMLNIDNANDILRRYDIKTKTNIESTEKKGFSINNKNILYLYLDEENLLTILEEVDNNISIKESILKTEMFELFPVLYTLNYNLYNLFSIDNKGPINYFDKDLQNRIQEITTANSIKNAILKYAEKNDNEIKNIINAYYLEDEKINEKQLRNSLNKYESELSEIVANRNEFFKEIKKIKEKIEEIKHNNIKIIKLIEKLEFTHEELAKLKKIEDEKIKETKIDKFIKNNTDIFIEFSKDNSSETIEDYIDRLINSIYKKIDTTPKELKDQLEKLETILETDIYNTYLIAIYYFLIMIIIKQSNNTLESIYEGNLIKKAYFGIRELEDLVEIINRNLLY